MDFVDLKTQYQSLKQEINTRIQTVLDHGQYIMGPEVAELEEQLAAYVGVQYCISASNGTDTLMIALMALGIGPGDEVITTPFTFVATGEMIALLGATPVFVDIDPKTFNIDPSRIEAAITTKTRAIMPVSLYGHCADMDFINKIADAHGLPVIEDAAQSFGAKYKSRRSCGLSTIGSTSFFPSKPLGCYGDGGALFTNDSNLAQAMRQIRVHGQDRRYHHPRIGINGRLDTIQAAILLAKLPRFDWEVERRAEIGAEYSKLIQANCPDVVIPVVSDDQTSVYAQYTVLVKDRQKVIDRLKEKGVPTAVHYPIPLNQQPAYMHLSRGDQTLISDRIASQVMSLPMSADLSSDDQLAVVNALAWAVEK